MLSTKFHLLKLSLISLISSNLQHVAMQALTMNCQSIAHLNWLKWISFSMETRLMHSALSFTRTLLMNVENSSLINSRKSFHVNSLKFQSKQLLDTRLSRVQILKPFVRTFLPSVMVVTFLVNVNFLKNKRLVKSA